MLARTAIPLVLLWKEQEMGEAMLVLCEGWKQCLMGRNGDRESVPVGRSSRKEQGELVGAMGR
eukprot:8502155-Prorocentrum_lima.AAC.1